MSAPKEGLAVARLLMVLSSTSPLFILLAIRGNNFVPDRYLLPFAAAMVLLPTFFLWLRIRTAVNSDDKKILTIGEAEDHRDHLLVYLFSMLIPFYPIEIATWRDLIALSTALCFIIFLFWHLNLHYMNLLFALAGFRIFTVIPPANQSSASGRHSFVLITRRTALSESEELTAYRLSDTVYVEVSK
jgi:hypothetical protein